MTFSLVLAVCSSLLWRGMLLGKSPRYLQAEPWSIQGDGFSMTALLKSGCRYIRARHSVDAHLQRSPISAFQRITCPGKLPARSLARNAFLVFLVALSICTSRQGLAQFGIPGIGGKSGQSNDQKANQLLHQHLPLVLDANNAYPTVPDQDLMGGPFHPRTLPITLDTLTKPLPPGDYVLPMTFFCSEDSVHRGGKGIAYQLGPAQGTAAKAISTLLWRGMLTGHKPQELQSVSWAIQGSVAYDTMPPKYKALVDQLIPDMKNQVNGQAFADIEDGFQGKVNRVTKKFSDAIGKGTGGFVHADIKVDVELNQSFERLGQVGRSALDGEKLNTIFTTAFPSDEARDQALYAGQGQQSAALPAANGPWSVKVPGVAYMRFMVHGGNLQGDNVMQIRILPPRTSQAQLDERPHLVLAGYEQTQQSTSSSPSVISLFNGSVNQAALAQCQATPVNQQVCTAQAIDMNGEMCYPVGTGAQACIATPTQPLPATTSAPRVCVKKILYEPVVKPGGHIGLCIYLGAFKDVGGSCGSSEMENVPGDQTLNWIQTFSTNWPIDCSPGVARKDLCEKQDGVEVKQHGPMYRSEAEGKAQDRPAFYSSGKPFNTWKTELISQGDLQTLFRDFPGRVFSRENCATRSCNPFTWHTAEEGFKDPQKYINPIPPSTYAASGSATDNDLRLVTYKLDASDPGHFNYTPLIRVRYGYSVNYQRNLITVAPLYIGHVTVDSGGGGYTQETDEFMADTGGTIAIDRLRKLDGITDSTDQNARPAACRSITPDPLNNYTSGSPFPYNTTNPWSKGNP